VFLGYIISSRGVKIDEEKIEAIRDWPKPASIVDVRSFHSLDSFFRQFGLYYCSYDRMFEKKERV
jgi:hypothetical protein